ncbi:MAG: winged helix-turn-helix transcriptional regulator [Candidatus Woesearchaeota archaeon]
MASPLFYKTLHMLSLNSKLTTKKLSKELQTSQQNISHILKKSQEEEIITNYETLIDPSRFGYDSFIIFIKIKNSSKRTLNKIEKLIHETHEITACYMLFGNYEFLLKFTSLNTSSFNKAFKEFLSNITEHIIDYTILTQIVEYYATPSYISSKRLRDTILTGADRSLLSISKKELDVLSLIQNNSRVSSSKIAIQLETTAKTVISTIKKLEDKEIIKGSIITYHPEKISVEQYLLFLRISFDENEKNLVDFLKTDNNVTKIIKVFGEWDIIVQFETFSHTQLQDCLEDIKEEFKIINYNYITIVRRLFWRTMPLLKNSKLSHKNLVTDFRE